jgi:Putative adhesin
MNSVVPARPRRHGLWIAVAVITAMVVLVPTGISAWGKLDQTTTSVSHDFGPASRLTVEVGSGQATVRAGAPGQVDLRATMRSSTVKPVIHWSWASGRVLSISVHCGPGCSDLQLQLTVPATLPVSANADEGEIVAQGLAGPLHLTTASGEVQGSGLASAQVTAAVTSGDVSLEFARSPSMVSAAVTSGSAEIIVPARSRYRVSRRVGSGSVTIAPGLAWGSGPGRIGVSVGSGSASVGYP